MNTQDLSARELSHMSPPDALALYGRLPSPTMQEMHGEFAGYISKQALPLLRLSGQLALRNPVLGYWMGKAFRPISDTLGRGYNPFRHVGGVSQHFAMQVALAPSRHDGKPAFQLVYRAFHSLLGDVHALDEVRRVHEGLYLGLGTAGWPHSGLRRFPALFVLAGPIGPYRGDVGRERASFRLEDELPTARQALEGRIEPLRAHDASSPRP